jgi:hypothetical protein
VAQAIFNHWFCKFSIPAQIHKNRGKEFVNKLSAERFEHSALPSSMQCTSGGFQQKG